MGSHASGEGRKIEMETDSEALPGCRSSATLDLSECVYVCVPVLWALALVATIASAVRDARRRNVL